MTDSKKIEKDTAVPITVNINMYDKIISNSIRKGKLLYILMYYLLVIVPNFN